MLPFQIDGNLSLLWFWAVWESAQFCVLSKLRTPLGKPQETFTAVEAVLKQYTTQITEAGEKSTEKGVCGGGWN